MTKLCFLDCETTGLDPDRHAIYELAIIVRTPGESPAASTELHWWLKADLATAEPTALRLTRYYERRANQRISPPRVVAETVAAVTAGAHLVGAVPSFDSAFLDRMLRAHGAAPAWHYHLVDVEALAAAKLGIEPPWNSDELARGLGVEVREEDRHTALGDARWAMRTYDAVFAPTG